MPIWITGRASPPMAMGDANGCFQTSMTLRVVVMMVA